jgi:hypothetical protein
VRRFSSFAAALAAALGLVWATSAQAYDEFAGTRALGMGGASRGWAIGDAGPLLNPSGMSLAKTFILEGAYGYGRRLDEHFLHATAVDNTSAYGIAGGLYYTYHSMTPREGVGGHGHEAGLSLSFPFGPALSIGATVKYFRFIDADAFNGKDGGLTFDLGLTVHPVPLVSLGLVGTNLIDQKNSNAPQAVGFGAALIPNETFAFVIDGVHHFTADNYTGRKGTSVMGGGEVTLTGRFSARLGGGYDARTGNGYMSAGVSALSEVGAFDAGIRQDAFQHEDASGQKAERETFVGVSLRLFIPGNQESQAEPRWLPSP